MSFCLHVTLSVGSTTKKNATDFPPPPAFAGLGAPKNDRLQSYQITHMVILQKDRSPDLRLKL